MARFYANIQGNRGETTRMGTKKSGISGHIRGWNIGCRVYCFVDKDGEDCIGIILTGGSNGFKPPKYLGLFKATDLED